MIALNGEVGFSRRRYRCGRCGREVYPCDLLLGLGDGSITPPLANSIPGARVFEVAGDHYACVSKPEFASTLVRACLAVSGKESP